MLESSAMHLLLVYCTYFLYCWRLFVRCRRPMRCLQKVSCWLSANTRITSNRIARTWTSPNSYRQREALFYFFEFKYVISHLFYVSMFHDWKHKDITADYTVYICPRHVCTISNFSLEICKAIFQQYYSYICHIINVVSYIEKCYLHTLCNRE